MIIKIEKVDVKGTHIATIFFNIFHPNTLETTSNSTSRFIASEKATSRPNQCICRLNEFVGVFFQRHPKRSIATDDSLPHDKGVGVLDKEGGKG